MSVSCITRIPDFEKLDIPEKQRRIHVSDEQIFQKLQMQYRQITDQQDGAVKGDYVLTDVIHADGKTKRVHIELGGKAFKNYQDALLGCKSGQEISVAGIVLRVLAVRKIIAFPLTDEAIQSLNISNITTVTGYRKNYLQNHGDEIADRVFHALQPKLISNVLALAQFILDPEEVDAYNGRQRVMLQNISGDVDARILKAFGSDGKKTLDECYQCYYEENKRNFMIYLWGRLWQRRIMSLPRMLNTVRL